MKLVSVILDIQTQALDAPYTYCVKTSDEGMQSALFSDADIGLDDPVLTEALAKELDPLVGATVLVPFGGRRAVGFIVGCATYEDGEVSVADETPLDLFADEICAERLKAVIAVLSEPYFDEDGVACALWLSHYYLAPLSTCIRLFVPPAAVPRVVREGGRWVLERPVVGEVDDRWVTRGPNAETVVLRKGSVKQEAVLRAVLAGDVRMQELSDEFGSVAAAVKALSDKGAVVVERRRRMRSPLDSLGPTGETPQDLPQLTPGQCDALDAIGDAVAAHEGRVVVVDGVTGSGKTEVYLRAIARVIEAGQNAIVLVPEISLTPQTVARFRGRFGDAVAVMHSRMSQGERYDQWPFIRSGRARVVVGARSALFTPLKNVGLIVIDEEHEGSYKQDSAPRYTSRDVAVWMMRRVGGAVVLGSATPSISSLVACDADSRWTRVELPKRANGKPLPPITVVDMAKEFGSGHRSMFSRTLTDSLREQLSLGRKAVMLLNQRGFAKFLLCRDCGFVPECPHCSTSLTYHERGNFIMCHHCGHRVAAPPVCPQCGSPYLKKFGAGTQRVEDELIHLIAGFDAPASAARVIRMDADTTGKKGAHQKLLDEFARADSAVLLGTQMIAKGLDFKDVTLVGVINADTQLHLPDFRAGERTFDLIQQVAGRAGRADLPGHVIVQTYESTSIPVRAAATYDRPLFLESELPKRRSLGYPPFVKMANILVWGKDEERVRLTAGALADQVRQCVRDYAGKGWLVMPAAPCLLAKLRNTYRWHIVVKAPAHADIAALLGPSFRARKAEADVSVAVDIDPEDLL